MSHLRISDVYLKDFPRTHNATTCKLWTNFIVALAGVIVFEGPKCSQAVLEEKFFQEYGNMAKTISKVYEDIMPVELYASGALMRTNFDLKSRNKKEVSAPTLYNGQNLLRKFKDVVKKEIHKSYNPLFERLFPGGKLPSGHQLEDQIMSFRKAFFFGGDNSLVLDLEDNPISEITTEVVGVSPVAASQAGQGNVVTKKHTMPLNYFPPLYLPFCAIGLFSDECNHLFHSSSAEGVTTENPPLHTQGNSRAAIKELVRVDKSLKSEEGNKKAPIDKSKTINDMTTASTTIAIAMTNMASIEVRDSFIRDLKAEIQLNEELGEVETSKDLKRKLLDF